ncbi:MAG: trimeric intracellular cation channel family protein [Bacteroidota bacterium]
MTVQYFFEVTGTGFFAISGALAASEKARPDWFGATFIGFITAIGGGSLRDMLLGSFPLAWVKDVTLLYAIFAGVVVANVLYIPLLRLRKSFLLFDTLGIAMFAILGAEKALGVGAHPIVAAIMGMFSAVMGGVIRDTLTNEIPIIFRKEIYATACFAGAAIFVINAGLGVERTLNFFVSGFLIVVIRLIAHRMNLSLPKFREDGPPPIA